MKKELSDRDIEQLFLINIGLGSGYLSLSNGDLERCLVDI